MCAKNRSDKQNMDYFPCECVRCKVRVTGKFKDLYCTIASVGFTYRLGNPRVSKSRGYTTKV